MRAAPTITASARPNLVMIWLKAVRPFSFTASLTPAILGAALAVGNDPYWPFLPLILLCSVLVHAGTNLTSEYFDHKNNLDRHDNFGKNNIIVQEMLSPKQVFIGGCVIIAVCTALAAPLFISRGIPLMIISAAGLAAGYFYTASPIGYKYFAMGDLSVFTMMGPLMVIGSYLSLTGSFETELIYIAAPVGMLVTAIMNGNNLRDIPTDTAQGIQTFSSLLGHKKAAYWLAFLIAAPFVIAAVLAFTLLSPWVLLVFLAAPLAISNIKITLNSKPENPAEIADLDIRGAKLHLAFGMLLVIAVLLGKVI